MNIYDEETLYALWMYLLKGVGNQTKRKLLRIYGTFANVYGLAKCELVNAGYEAVAEVIEAQKDLDEAKRYYERAFERNIQIIYWKHPLYPEKLAEIYDPPIILFVRGIIQEKLRIHNRCIGVVGARKPSLYGKQIGKYFASELAMKGYTIVSGLARGIDGCAHFGALEANGYTVAVLGSGINVPYPKENIELYQRIESTGTIISEYGLDEQPLPAYFPQRNRIISGLSDGVLVIEAKEKSGSLITADLALEQGRQVYAVPGRISDANSAGTNNLIKQGAMCVTSINDVIYDMEGREQNGQMVMMLDEDSMELSVCDTFNSRKNALAPIEKMVYSCLSLDPVYIDDIIKKAGIGITKVISVLYELETKGFVTQPLKGYYIVTL